MSAGYNIDEFERSFKASTRSDANHAEVLYKRRYVVDISEQTEYKTLNPNSLVSKDVVVSIVEDDVRATALVSMTKSEKNRLTSIAKAHGLSLSAFLRLAANEYIANHNW